MHHPPRPDLWDYTEYVIIYRQGCDASIILRSSGNNTAEKDHPDNISLAGDGYDTVIKAKAAVDNVPACKNKVSCADILAMATRDVVALVNDILFTSVSQMLLYSKTTNLAMYNV